jgi:hypothetical protein
MEWDSMINQENERKKQLKKPAITTLIQHGLHAEHNIQCISADFKTR